MFDAMLFPLPLRERTVFVSRRDAMKIAQCFQHWDCEYFLTKVPKGRLNRCRNESAVPSGLSLSITPIDPALEVLGYYHIVPSGRTAAETRNSLHQQHS